MDEKQTEEHTTQAQPVVQPELSITDLQNIKSILDVSARRGTFSAAEMEAVGSTYNKLTKFLDTVAPQAPVEKA